MSNIYMILLSTMLLSSTLFANKHIEWNLILKWKSTLTPLSSPSFRVSRLVKDMSNGKFIIKIDGLEKHRNKESLLALVQKNKYQLAHTDSGYSKELDINTIWFSGIPLGMTSKEQYAWFYFGGGKSYMDKVYDKFEVLSFPGGDLGSQMGGWFKKEIKDISDFQNLKVNTQGITSEILSMYKVNVKNIPNNKAPNAFLNDELDMINGTSPSMDIKMGFHKVAPYYYTSWNKPASQMQFLVNKESFEKLPHNYQVILTTAIKTAAYDLYHANFYESLEAWSKIKKSFSKYQNQVISDKYFTRYKKY